MNDGPLPDPERDAMVRIALRAKIKIDDSMTTQQIAEAIALHDRHGYIPPTNIEISHWNGILNKALKF